MSSGVNSFETALTPANLTVSTFSKQFLTAVDGQIYAQPLYVPGVVVTGGPQAGTHNLAIVATQHDSLYAIDLDSGVIVWQTSFLASGLPGATAITTVSTADVHSADISPEIGICGTPVIDGSTKLLYVAAKTKQILNGNTTSPNFVYTLYKIDITNGNATVNANIVGSTVIGDTVSKGSAFTFRTNTDPAAAQDPFVFGTGDGAITVNGQSRVYFNGVREMNRPGLLLAGGSVYICFGSHGDNSPYHGWMLGFDKNTLAIMAVLNLTPNGGLGGIWGGGAIPTMDANGNFYVMTGNGTFDGFNNNGVAAGLDSLGFPVNGDYGDSVVKISVDPTTSPANQNKNGWGLKVVDYFAPFNNQMLSSTDTDLGSGGCTLLPDSAGSVTHPHLLVGAGKQGNVYLIDRDAMGKFTATTDNVVQSQKAIASSYATPAFFNGLLYYGPSGDRGKSFSIANAAMSATLAKTPDSFGFPGATPTISANGTTNAVVWTVDLNSGQLRAYSAVNLATEIWTSALASNNRDQLGVAVKYSTPTVADGRVMVGTSSDLVIYGPPLAITGPPVAPTLLVAAAISALEIDLSWTNNATTETGFAIEQSPDGVNFTQIGTVGVNVTSFPVVSGLQAGTTYYFRVRAFNTYQTLSYSDYTNIANATTFTASALPDADIGSPSHAGSASVSSGIYTVKGGGQDIWSTSDQFNYCFQSNTTDKTIIAHVDSIQNTNRWAKAGLMFRNSTAAAAAYVGVYEDPGSFVTFQWRDMDYNLASGIPSQVSSTAAANWLKLVKSGNIFKAYYATVTGTPAATDWILIGTHVTTFTNANYLAGLAVTAHNGALLNTSVFSSYSIQDAVIQPPGLTDMDIGGPGLAGSATVNGSVFTVNGGGRDIWSTSDQFNYCFQTNTTDKTIIAHVDSIQNTDRWAKAGLMFRNSTAAGDAYVGLYENPGNVVELQWRDVINNQAATGSHITSASSANWLKLVKSGNTFTAYYATVPGTPAPSDWILVAVHTTAFTNSSYLGGFAVTAHNNALLNTSVFSGYSQQ